MDHLDKSVYGEHVVFPVCPSVTWWTAHEPLSKVVVEGYHQFLSSLTMCYNEQQEPEASILMLLRVWVFQPIRIGDANRWWFHLSIWSANIYWNDRASIIYG